MSEEEQDEKKRALQALLREYDANKGMAGLVCGRPVELMPQDEQDRIFNGFCTPGNIQILMVSHQKLVQAKSLNLTEQEETKIASAIPTLEQLIDAFSAFREKSIDKAELRSRVRHILHNPIPDTQDGLEHSLSHMIETLNFLTEQDLSTKDGWDRMVDCVQLHDALSRTKDVCENLQDLVSLQSSPAINKTLEVTKNSLQYLETFFSKGEQGESLQIHFNSLSEQVRDIWASTK